MGLLVYLLFAGCVTVSSAVTCYSCVESNVLFNPEDGLFELTNCSAPSQNNDFVDTNTNCTGTCVTSISLRTSYYNVGRYCLPEGSPSYLTSQCDRGCTNPSNCIQCCDSDFCNNAAVDDIIEENRLGQTCYVCQHSEIPGTGNFNPSCGLNFDSEGTGLMSYSFCEGLCYSAVTFIEGVEDVRRGCQSSGSSCDHVNHPYLEDKSVRIGSLDYDMKCCLGSLCNGGRSIGSAISMIVLAVFLAQFLALAL